MAVVEYDGTAYHGFQVQSAQLCDQASTGSVQQQSVLPTIQGEIERALASVTQECIRIAGAGRTDTGVHARGQVISFRTGWGRSLEELHRAVNARLAKDIVLRSLEEAPPEFHARFSARSRRYRYSILNTAWRSPLMRWYTYHVRRPLDERLMDRACAYLVGSHDFAAFGQPTRGSSTVRRVLDAHCWREGDLVAVEVEANGFLRRMMRSVVGTLLEVGSGRMTLQGFQEVLESRDRAQAAGSVPAHGLCLIQVKY